MTVSKLIKKLKKKQKKYGDLIVRIEGAFCAEVKHIDIEKFDLHKDLSFDYDVFKDREEIAGQIEPKYFLLR